MIVECKECEAKVDGIVVATQEYPPDEDFTYFYSFLKCPRCQRPMLVRQAGFEDERDEPERIYPSLPIRVNPSVPDRIRTVYEEAISCFRAKAYRAAVLMCRKTLEEICRSHSHLEGDLAAALRQLRDKGIIESRLYLWADALRISGSEAAHDAGVTGSREEASDVLDFTSALLEFVFTFQEKFEQFQKRRANSPSTGRASGEAYS